MGNQIADVIVHARIDTLLSAIVRGKAGQRDDGHLGIVLAGIPVAADPYTACSGAEVLVVLTEWDEFKWLDFDKVAESMTAKRVVDGRNLLDRSPLHRRGFQVDGIGR